MRKIIMKKLLMFAVLNAAASSTALAAGQSSTNYVIPRDATNNGVADMSSANYRLASSLGDGVATAVVLSAGYQIRGGFRALAAGGPAPVLVSVVSRKTHGSVGTFDLPIDRAPAITGAVSVEPRVIGSGHAIVFNFDQPVTTFVGATVKDSSGNTVVTPTASVPGSAPNSIVVIVPGLADNRRVLVSVTGVNGATDAVAAIGFLVGDVNNSRMVNANDITAVKARAGTRVDAGTFQYDLNTSGVVNATDISAVKARSTTTLPPN